MERLLKEVFILSHQLYKGILILKHSNGETCYMLVHVRNKNHSNYSSGAQSKIHYHALNSHVLLTLKRQLTLVREKKKNTFSDVIGLGTHHNLL